MAAYEAERKRRMEENHRRMEELGLHHLAAAAAMPPQAKQPKPKHKARVPGAATTASVDAEPRQSARVAELPEQPDYREIRVGPTAVDRSHIITKAKELEGELGAHYPTFSKIMTQSYVTRNIMALPTQFCRKHLPEDGKVITLVDEEDSKFDVQYFKGRNYFYIKGWKGFAIDHKLADADQFVFQLVEQKRFKVYIIRAASYLKIAN